eukprot:CAMPEP_0184396166 /NCGR_PEP_ID=MMETSP0007-20130409/46801_1 /TAXON_ID=97485 /ORGANISM="Prymnesium parvum, Strain Texoma1" /LENGTH=33 /DNA_ID=CAMNT_0026748731 /DNA_START=535 /DNA_END=633 /DNA_ORIENTATION=+
MALVYARHSAPMASTSRATAAFRPSVWWKSAAN